MKILSSLAFSLLFLSASAQQFLNGDFENTTSVGCNYNLANADFNLLMSNVVAYGPNEEMDIQTGGGCYGVAPSGQTFVSLAVQNDASLLVDAITLELAAPLVAGYQYTMSFYLTGNNDFGGNGDSIILGVSDVSNAFGQKIYTHFPNLTQWEQLTFSFTSPVTGQYVSVQNQGAVYGWTFVDDFVMQGKGTGVNPVSTDNISVVVIPGDRILCSSPMGLSHTSVYNTLGQLITSATDSKETVFNISGWSKGIYIVQCTDELGQTFNRKVSL